MAALVARGHVTVAAAGAGGPGRLNDYFAMRNRPGPVLLDAVLWLRARRLALPALAAAVPAQPIDRVLLVPPWPALRVTDAEHRGSMAEAVVEYRDLLAG